MNHRYPLFGVGVAVLFLVTPLALYAEEVVTGQDTNMGTTPPPINADGVKPPLGGGSESAMRRMPIRAMMSSTTGNGHEGEGMKGGRMMASDTRPLPPGMDKMIQKRDGEKGREGSTTLSDMRMRGRMMATGTSKDCIGATSNIDCVGNRGDMRTKMGEHRGEVFEHVGNMILKRMHAAIQRFAKLADRIDSRIAKMKAAGTDTTAAEAAEVNARTKIIEANTAVTAAETAVKAVAASFGESTSTPPSDGEKKPAKDVLEAARKAILAAVQALSDVMPLLMGGHKDMSNQEHATSSMASGTPKLPGMMRTKDRPMPTTTSEGTHGTL